MRVSRRGSGYSLTMRLPFVSRDDMDVHRRGDELFVRVGSYKRNLILPQTLKGLEVRGANFVGDHVEIAFSEGPEPGSSQDARNSGRGGAKGGGAAAKKGEGGALGEGQGGARRA